MFTLGFEKTAKKEEPVFVQGFTKCAKPYSSVDHYIDLEESDAKHTAKMDPLHRGKSTAVGAGAGAVYGAGMGALGTHRKTKMRVIGTKKKGDVVGILVKMPKAESRSSYLKRVGKSARRGAGLGGVVGGALGLGIGQLHKNVVKDAKSVSKMNPQERRGYLKAQYERHYGKEK